MKKTLKLILYFALCGITSCSFKKPINPKKQSVTKTYSDILLTAGYFQDQVEISFEESETNHQLERPLLVSESKNGQFSLFLEITVNREINSANIYFIDESGSETGRALFNRHRGRNPITFWLTLEEWQLPFKAESSLVDFIIQVKEVSGPTYQIHGQTQKAFESRYPY